MNGISINKPTCNLRPLYSRMASAQAVDHTVEEAIARSRREEIGVRRDEAEPDLYHADRPFVPGTEEILVNGVHYYPADYILEVDTEGHATGFIIEMSEPTDDVHLVADPVEN